VGSEPSYFKIGLHANFVKISYCPRQPVIFTVIKKELTQIAYVRFLIFMWLKKGEMSLASSLLLSYIKIPPDTMESCKARINVHVSCIGREE